MGLVLVALWWWWEPTLGKVGLAAVTRALPDFRVEARSVERRGLEHLEIRGLRVRLRADGSEVIALERVDVFASWRELAARRIRELRLDAPEVRVTDALLAMIEGMGGGDGATTPWTIDALKIESGRVGVKIAGVPPLSVSLEAQLSGVRTGGVGDDAEQRVVLSNLRLETREEPGTEWVRVPRVEATFTWRELLDSRRLAKLRIENPEVRYDRAVERTLASPDSAPVAEPAAGAPWHIGVLEIAGARVRLDDLGASAPAVAFGVDAELREVPLGADPAADAEQMQIVTIRGLEVRAPGGEGEPFARAPLLRARFRWRELLADRWINAVELDRPRVRWDAELQRAFTSAPAAAAAQAPPSAPFRIGILQISRAAFDIGSIAPGLPGARFELDGGMTEVPLGALAGEWPEAEQAVAIRDLALLAPDASGAPFLRIPAAYTTFTWRGILAQKRLGLVRIDQPELKFDPAVSRALSSGATPTAKPSTDPERAWHVDELSLFDGRVELRDLGLGLPPIGFGVSTTFRDMALSLEGDALRNTVQTIELHNLALQSPLDPFTSVLKLPTLFIRFTPAGLWRRQIEQVEIIHPILNVGEDLFWYIDRVQARDSGAVPGDPAPPRDGRSWTINRFDVTSGQLVLAFDGRPKLPLPLPFETHARGLNFEKLSELRLTLDLVVPEQDYIYPEYGLTLRGVSGRLQFSLPPQQGANNLVHTLKVADLRWKDYRARELFVDVTFDEKAIHGNIGGKAYQGYLRGAFDFGLDAGSSWNGWVSGSRVDLKQMTDAFSPEKLSLSGPADFSMNVAARAKVIDRFDGDFRGLGRGELHIGKLNEIIRDLPPEWEPLKRAATRIGLETIRDFTYDTGRADFRFNGRSGRASLDLRGPSGSRRLDAQVYDAAGQPPAVQVTTR